MPPKKGGKKDGPAKFADKENLARAETEVLSLQRLLELRSFEVQAYHNSTVACCTTLLHAARLGMPCMHLSSMLLPMLQALEARRSERLWREKTEAFTQALEQHKEDTLDITADMVRQYKAMQVTMSKRVAELEAESQALQDTVKAKDEQIAKLQVRCLHGRGGGKTAQVGKGWLKKLTAGSRAREGWGFDHQTEAACSRVQPGRSGRSAWLQWQDTTGVLSA